MVPRGDRRLKEPVLDRCQTYGARDSRVGPLRSALNGKCLGRRREFGDGLFFEQLPRGELEALPARPVR